MTLKYSRQRQAVWDFIQTRSDHPTASIVYEEVRRMYPNISLGTVSVSIAFILLVGIISGIMPSWQISRFQPIDIVKGSFRYRSKMVLGNQYPPAAD